jgi:hypothetical protein
MGEIEAPPNTQKYMRPKRQSGQVKNQKNIDSIPIAIDKNKGIDFNDLNILVVFDNNMYSNPKTPVYKRTKASENLLKASYQGINQWKNP